MFYLLWAPFFKPSVELELRKQQSDMQKSGEIYRHEKYTDLIANINRNSNYNNIWLSSQMILR